MSNKNTNPKQLSLLSAVLLLQATSYIAVLLNIPVARQILLFAYLTFVPGYLIVKLLRFNFESLETLVFSTGFSIAFLMLVGLALNELGFMVGLSQPLSTVPLLIALNNIILAAALLAYLRNETVELPRFSFSLVRWIVPLLVPLVLSVVGAVFVGVYNDNFLLLVMILTISLFAAFLILKDAVPSVVYVFAVLIIGVSLLFHSLLVSKYLISFRSDVIVEHFVFRNTVENGFWYSVPPAHWDVGLGRLNGMLSITILATVYSNLLGLDSAWIFKLVFPLIFAFVPLCLHRLWGKSFGLKWAFVSAFFFMATAIFYTELLGLNRQMIAELFFVLLLFVLLNKCLSHLQRIVSFTFFGFGLVVSHYGLAEIFLFLIVFALVCLLVFRRQSSNLTMNMGVLFFVIMFAWYIFTSRASVFESFLNFGEHVYRQLREFFNPESRGETVLRGLGLESPPTIWNAIGRVFAYATEFLIVVGFIGFVLKRKKFNTEREHFVMISGAIGFLAALIIVPGLAETMNMTRFYHVLLFFLAPLCAFGANFLADFLFKHKKEFVTSILLTGVLIPYFLFQTGFMYTLVGVQTLSLLNKPQRSRNSLRGDVGYFDESEVFGALWVSRYVDADGSKMYVDSSSYGVLIGYAMIFSGNFLSNVTEPSKGSYIYLNEANIFDNAIIVPNYHFNTTTISSVLGLANKVYSNGGCDIYKYG